MRAGSNNIAPLVWALLSLERGCAAPRKILGIETPVRVGCHDRTGYERSHEIDDGKPDDFNAALSDRHPGNLPYCNRDRLHRNRYGYGTQGPGIFMAVISRHCRLNRCPLSDCQFPAGQSCRPHKQRCPIGFAPLLKAAAGRQGLDPSPELGTTRPVLSNEPLSSRHL